VNAPVVSVVIPAYNAAAFIERTLKTVAEQTYRSFEVLVVDDGSKDDTQGVVDRFLAANGLPGRCIRQQNKKIAAARNTGIAAARGALIAFLDHDDTWYPDKLALAVAELERRPEIGLLHHPCRIVDADGRPVRLTYEIPGGADAYRSLLLLGNGVCPSAVVVRKTKLAEVGGFRENPEFDTVEDYDLWMRLARVCRFAMLDQVLGDYLVLAGGASKRVVYHYENLARLLQDHFARYERQDPWTRLLMRRRLSQVYRAAGRALLNSGDADGARSYIGRMLRAFPFEPKNLAVAAYWAARAGRSRPVSGTTS
jgi:glycosyltransferase involved in cell wall biosynthesis